jgi:hypothetical protein
MRVRLGIVAIGPDGQPGTEIIDVIANGCNRIAVGGELASIGLGWRCWLAHRWFVGWCQAWRI